MKIMKRLLKRSIFVYHLNTGGCNGCDTRTIREYQSGYINDYAAYVITFASLAVLLAIADFTGLI